MHRYVDTSTNLKYLKTLFLLYAVRLFNSDCIGVSVDSVNTIKLFFIHVIVLMHR